MSLTEIEIHFEKMKSISDDLSEIAAGLQKMANIQGKEAVMDVKKAWVSENTEIFTKAGMQRMEDVCKAAEDLQKISEDVLERAKQIYEVEKWNVLMAKTRIY